MGSTKLRLRALAESDTSWMDYGKCLGCDPELFFPERGDSISLEAARRVCAGCVVRDTCAEHGIAHEKFGVWGGPSSPAAPPHPPPAQARGPQGGRVMAEALICENCGAEARGLHPCPCGIGECPIAFGVCEACRRNIQRNARVRRFEHILAMPAPVVNYTAVWSPLNKAGWSR